MSACTDNQNNHHVINPDVGEHAGSCSPSCRGGVGVRGITPGNFWKLSCKFVHSGALWDDKQDAQHQLWLGAVVVAWSRLLKVKGESACLQIRTRGTFLSICIHRLRTTVYVIRSIKNCRDLHLTSSRWSRPKVMLDYELLGSSSY